MNKKILFAIILLFISTLLLLGVMKGNVDESGELKFQRDFNTEMGGPFESSGSNSRYALVSALVENQTFFFSEHLARFSAPDVTAYQGKFFSIFTPGVSFFTIPFYKAGAIVGIPQIGAYVSTMMIALGNMVLVFAIAKKLGVRTVTAGLSGFLFLFATNALPYSLTLTQHHLSISVLLLSVLLLFSKPSLARNIFLGFLYGCGLLVDIPNGFLLLPIILCAIFQHFTVEHKEKNVTLKIKFVGLFLIVGLMGPMALFGWYNQTLTGSPTLLGQSIGRSDLENTTLPATRKTEEPKEIFSPKYPFYSRHQLNGLYILLISNERGILYYMPIVLIGLIGLILSARKNDTKNSGTVILGVIAANIMVYSMFGDPWGGWAYGPRYLLPAIALLSCGIGLAIDRYQRHIIFGILFVILAFYSIRVATLGAFTTTQVPPKQEADHLLTFIPYTYAYNQNLIRENKTHALSYHLFFSRAFSVSQIVMLYQGIVFGSVIILYTISLRKNRGKGMTL